MKKVSTATWSSVCRVSMWSSRNSGENRSGRCRLHRRSGQERAAQRSGRAVDGDGGSRLRRHRLQAAPVRRVCLRRRHLERRVIARIEHGPKGANPRYIVTNLEGDAQDLSTAVEHGASSAVL